MLSISAGKKISFCLLRVVPKYSLLNILQLFNSTDSYIKSVQGDIISDINLLKVFFVKITSRVKIYFQIAALCK